MIDERMEEQASLYVLGALTPEETQTFETTLRSDAELQGLVAKLHGAAEALARTVPRLIPPPALKQRILAEIEKEEHRHKVVPLPHPTPGGLPVWLSWALAACLAVFAGVLWKRGQNWQAETAALEAKLASTVQLEAQARQQARDLQRQLGSLQTELAALQDKYNVSQMRVAILTSLLQDSPKSVAVSVWDNTKQEGVFVGENLKTLPADKDYQLWVLDPRNQNPIDAGVFTIDDKGRVRYPFKAKAQVQVPEKFAVTIEPKGGAARPTLNQMVLIGL
jgi:anti-sigma-K factor RskA